MKYFFKWLVNDIKTSWAENASAREQMWEDIMEWTKKATQFLSVVLLFVTVIAIIVIKSTGGDFSWVAVSKVVFGIVLLNAIFYLNEKLNEYHKEKERLMQTLRD
jgi:hypothetical protein